MRLFFTTLLLLITFTTFSAGAFAKTFQTSPSNVIHQVPFTPQAPFANWSDDRQQNGCEEVAILMVSRWIKQQSLTKEDALKEILKLSHYQETTYGYYDDTSAADTTKLLREYYKIKNVKVMSEVTIEAIKKALTDGFLVITPMNGQGLNPYYKRPGPERHMIVIIGFDDKKQEFITNDPGTRRGQGYRYKYKKFFNAIRDYPSGNKVPNKENKKAMIVVGR